MTFMRSPNTLLPLSLAGLLACAAPAVRAADTTTEAIIGGTLIHNVRTAWAGRSPQQRADQVQQRLNVALAQAPIHPKTSRSAQVQGDWCVLFRGRRFLTADPLTAKQDHSNPQALAAKWARHLRHVLPDLTKAKGK